jgi:hypothetical protein
MGCAASLMKIENAIIPLDPNTWKGTLNIELKYASF